MATADECETQRFYLRKIEGAEILLSYETNFFRQELHKWSPVAPEPPPVLEVSKSTRKPRPTKLQKLMAQHGVDDPENLPQNVKMKPHNFNKRKSSEPMSRPPPLQPAPSHGHSSGNTPTSHAFSNPNIHPALAGHDHAHPSHFGGFGGVEVGREPHFTMSPQTTNSPAFAPHAFMHSANHRMTSPGFIGSPPRPGIFNDAAFGRLDNMALGGGDNDSPMRDAFVGSSQGVNRMFDELTNQEDEGPKGEIREKIEEGRDEAREKWEGDEEMEMFLSGP